MLRDPFLTTLAAKIDGWPGGEAAPIAVAFSGGLDSTLLLTALCRLARAGPLRAVHVDHGLHPDSRAWETACRTLAARLGVGYAAARVDVARDSRHGLEAAARDARYRVLEQMLAPGEILMTAHHADDQLETVLFRMLRGAGTRGLRGIIELSKLGRGYLGRPLLDFSRAALREQARRWDLSWSDDPANEDRARDRNYLRLEILPRLKERWPAAPQMACRLAQQMSDAEEILEAMAAQDARGLAEPDRVPRAHIAGLAPSRQRNLLRHLIREIGLPTPSARHVEELRASLLEARRGAQTAIRWPGGEGRVYADSLYLLPPLPPASGKEARARLHPRDTWSGSEGRIAFVPSDAPGLPQSWLDAGLELRFRTGGERFQPLGRARSMSLKRWLHDTRVLPWMRGRVPLLYSGDELVAVADLALADRARSAPADPRWRVVWTQHPAAR